MFFKKNCILNNALQLINLFNKIYYFYVTVQDIPDVNTGQYFSCEGNQVNCLKCYNNYFGKFIIIEYMIVCKT